MEIPWLGVLYVMCSTAMCAAAFPRMLNGYTQESWWQLAPWLWAGLIFLAIRAMIWAVHVLTDHDPRQEVDDPLIMTLTALALGAFLWTSVHSIWLGGRYWIAATTVTLAAGAMATYYAS